MDLLNKVAIITGATGGIGSELVTKLDDEGAQLVLVSKNEAELQKLLQTLKNKTSRYYVCDFSNQNETERIAKEISSNFKSVDLLVNSAGVGIYKPIEDATLEDFNNSINIGLSSVFILTKELLASLSKSSEALILNIGSGAGVIPMSGRSIYCTTKFGLRGLTLSLAEEFRRVNNPKFCLITLGSTLTSFGPLSFEKKKEEMENGKAYFTPEWVGKKVVEIIKDSKRETEYTFYPGDYGFGEWHKPEPK